MRLILASQSGARQAMLRNAGIAFEARPAHIDEKALMEAYEASGKSAPEIAAALAVEKARVVSVQNKDALVIGSDQILECEGELLSKALSKEEARAKLLKLSGQTHRLISAVSVVRDGEVLWQNIDQASLTMRSLESSFLAQYCAQAGDALTRCVGAYELEGLGIQLFDQIEGDYFTILGMPLLPLLCYLRAEHGVGL